MLDYIKKKYSSVKKKYDLTTPTDLLKQADIDLLQIPLDDNTGGFTITNDRCSTVVINSDWDSHYSDFVILHEFSHIILHGGSSTPYYRRIGLDRFVPKIEREANELAIKLLLSMQDPYDLSRCKTKYQLMFYLGLDEDLIEYL